MDLHCHSVEKYAATSTRLDTSVGRGWSGLVAERWLHGAGEMPAVVPRGTEIAIAMEGTGVVERWGGGAFQHVVARRGTVWLCPAGIREDRIRSQHEGIECLHLFLPASPFPVGRMRKYAIHPDHAHLRYETIADDRFFLEIAWQIGRELLVETSTGSLLIESLADTLSTYLLHRYAAFEPGPRRGGRRPAVLDASRLARIEAFIDAHLDRAFSVSQLAEVACLSPAHFARSFKAATGHAPHAFVSLRRLEHAKRMLAEGGRSIGEIALRSGFSSQANFARAFRHALGVAPGRYRRETCRRNLR